MPMDFSRYPPDWKTISLYIRFSRAGGRCEGSPKYPDCRAKHGEPHPVTGSKVVLTTAHLGTPILSDQIGPVEFPFFFLMAGFAETDEIFQTVRFLVALQAKQFERSLVMYNGTIAERFAIFPANLTNIIIPQSCFSFSLFPSGSIIGNRPTTPIGISFTSWRLFTKPFKPTSITTKSIPLPDLVAAYFIKLPATLANLSGQGSISFMGIDSVQFSTTQIGTGFLVIFSLFSSERENFITNNTDCFGSGSPYRTIGNWFAQSDSMLMFLETLRGASFLMIGGLINREWKHLFANNTDTFSSGLPNFTTGTRELFAESSTAQKFTAASIGTSSFRIGGIRDKEGVLTDFADFNFHTCIVPQYHTGTQIPYYTPGDKHDKLDCRPENLAAMCQRCHLYYDLPDHMRKAAETRRLRKEGKIPPKKKRKINA
jgi:hypothetical protein